MTTLGVVSTAMSERTQRTKTKNVPDGVTSAQTEPLGDGTVLSHLLGKNSLSAERLLGRLFTGVRMNLCAETANLPSPNY